MNIRFEPACPHTRPIIFAWLDAPHFREFWDNSQEHRDDIDNFIFGRPQTYISSTTRYWVGFYNDTPFCFVLSDMIAPTENHLPKVFQKHLSAHGHTICLDFGIGNEEFLGRGLAASTLIRFIEFYRSQIDPSADTFFIDPDENNPRAAHVYKKAGFHEVEHFIPTKGAFVGHQSKLMVKQVLSVQKK